MFELRHFRMLKAMMGNWAFEEAHDYMEEHQLEEFLTELKRKIYWRQEDRSKQAYLRNVYGLDEFMSHYGYEADDERLDRRTRRLEWWFLALELVLNPNSPEEEVT